MATAKDRVLGTAELLEAILLELDMTTLLHSQRVNKTFRSAIDTSINLQRALWFKPTPPEMRQPNASRINPLFIKHGKRLGILYIMYSTNARFGPEPNADRYDPRFMRPCNIVGMHPKHTQRGSFEDMLPIQTSGGVDDETWLFGEGRQRENPYVIIDEVDKLCDRGEAVTFFEPSGHQWNFHMLDYTFIGKQKEPLTLAEMREVADKYPHRKAPVEEASTTAL